MFNKWRNLQWHPKRVTRFSIGDYIRLSFLYQRRFLENVASITLGESIWPCRSIQCKVMKKIWFLWCGHFHYFNEKVLMNSVLQSNNCNCLYAKEIRPKYLVEKYLNRSFYAMFLFTFLDGQVNQKERNW